MTVHANYLRDLGHLLRDAAEQARKEADQASESDRQYATGRQMAYYEVLSLMEQQAVAFDLPVAELGLDGLDAERDLL